MTRTLVPLLALLALTGTAQAQQHEEEADQRRAAPDDGEVKPAHRQDVAKEIGFKVDPRAGDQRHRHQSQRQRAMGQHAQQGVRRVAALAEDDDDDRHGQRHQRHPGKDRNAECQRHGNPQDRRMRGGIAEIGHAPPDHETAQRPRRHRDADSCEDRAPEEIVDQAHASASAG